jgi:type IV pilus assembly protein PilE
MHKGFTLIEMLIVMLVFSVLVAIAYPSYNAFILQSHRTDAQAALTQDQTTIERCYAQNFSYNTACSALPTFPHNSTQGFYSIALSNLTSSTYTLTATPIGSQIKDTTCASLAVTQANVKTGTDTSGTSQVTCWNL